MSGATAPAASEIAAVLELAADHIDNVGFCKRYLYSVHQAESGLPLDECQVDAIGAINVVVHGTPRHVGGDPLTRAAEKAVEARIEAPSLATWCDHKGNNKEAAVQLLRDTAASLREAP
ncbi:DUF6197 family protein [Streptomyces sp. FxanaA7]|uniref:DUF6197 family protein n=1 Tax=Streptomyces sp. FxanaA7 TaxID=1265492 RepID=UPI0005F057F0|nr:hypothetical protein [Streptomyces sp. FxanaA7]